MPDRPHCVAFIFARGGSQGVPRKNIRLLGGKPLIAHSIDVARATPGVDRVVVSTDDREIADVSLRAGAEVPFLRPAELARNDSPEWHAWRHAIDAIEHQGRRIDLFMSLPATSPLRSIEDVQAGLDAFQADPSLDFVLAVTPAHRNPYLNMVRFDERGDAHIMLKPEKPIYRRQDAPSAYDMTTSLYITRPDYIRRHVGCFVGRTRAIIVPQERSIDIDTEVDFEIAEMLLARTQRLAQKEQTPCVAFAS